jgi:hypothetical protein
MKASLSDLPSEMIQEIMDRASLVEMKGLCDANPSFREHCNHLSKRELERDFKDTYAIYLQLRKAKLYRACLTTVDGQSRFATAQHTKDVIDKVKRIMMTLELTKYGKEISFSTDRQSSPCMVCIDWHFFVDPELEQDFKLIVTGDFGTHKAVQAFVDQIADMYDNL